MAQHPLQRRRSPPEPWLRSSWRCLCATIAVAILAAFAASTALANDGEVGENATPDDLEFFEKEVRPLLAARCQECHGPEQQKGNLRLDSRAAVVSGGDTGPAVVPGDSDESLLVDAVRYGDVYQMPPKGKLSDDEIAKLVRWVDLGAPWPPGSSGDAVPLEEDSAFDVAERADHWCYLPPTASAPPATHDRTWPRNAIDQFLLARREQERLGHNPPADRRTWLRRITFDMTGLPPTPDEIAVFLADPRPDAAARVVDRLLASPRYGERWGRHWLDVVRFTETLGHEFDYDLHNAWRYRDYVIRAFNADVRYDQFVIEHLAGDLLTAPRRDAATGDNESVVGTAFFWFPDRSHSPVDVRQQQLNRTENQLDVLTKAVLAQTFACARCHDHKFDAISIADYYSLSGFLNSARYQQAHLDPPERIAAKAARLRELENDLRAAVQVDKVAAGRDTEENGISATSAESDDDIPLGQFDDGDFDGWFVAGDAFGERPTVSGQLDLGRSSSDASSLWQLTGGLAHSGAASRRLEGELRSPSFTINRRYLHLRLAGQGGRVNIVVDGFTLIRDPIYGELSFSVDSDALAWRTVDLGPWIGHRAYLELVDSSAPNLTYPPVDDSDEPKTDYIVADSIVLSNRPETPQDESIAAAFSAPLSPPPDPQAELAASRMLTEFQAIESSIPRPRRAPALAAGTPENEHLLIRGNYRTAGPEVARRLPTVFGGDEIDANELGAGRLTLARRLVDGSNPLAARVMVNRIWQHHFGAGLVRTPDDFGQMGDSPSHSELLDWLAVEFVDSGWSIKRMHRMMLLSATYEMASAPRDDLANADPNNALLGRMPLRRLEAESIRDAMLAVAGRLNTAMFGPGPFPFLTDFMAGRGRPTQSGPLDGDGRRSAYLMVRRNFLMPMLLAFDFPKPASAAGRRATSNVPAQALALLNNPLVADIANEWAVNSIAAYPSPRERVCGMYEAAYGRPPADQEIQAALEFIAEQEQRRQSEADADAQSWTDYAHVLLNSKEFLLIP